MTTPKKPIALFDSGLGGLTVLKVLAEKFPHESFVYLGDLARLPYGNKSPETIRKYGEQILNFLLGYQPKAFIIACNTASTVFLEEKNFKNIPLLNVIGPGAQAAVEASKTQQIGVLATSATISSHAYSHQIKQIKSAAVVQEVACPLFVPLAEEGWANDPITEQIIAKYLAGLKKIDTLVLGCTHYPILKNAIAKVVGPTVTLIESGEVLASKLEELNILDHGEISPRELTILTTDITTHFESLSKKLMEPIQIKALERVVL